MGMDDPSAALLASPKAQIIETLGAGVMIRADTSDRSWAKRFEMELWSDTSAKTVKERHDEIKTSENMWDSIDPPFGPGTHKLEYPPHGTASIVLQPVMGKYGVSEA